MTTEAVKDDHISFEKNPGLVGTTDAAGRRGCHCWTRSSSTPQVDSNVRLTNLKTGDAQ